MWIKLPVQRSWARSTFASMLAEFAQSGDSRLEVLSCQRVCMMRRRECMWNCSSCLICLRWRVNISNLNSSEESTTVLYTFSLVDKRMSLCCNTLKRSLPIAWLAFWIRAVTSLFREPSLEIVLPRYLKVSTFFNWVPSMVMHGDYGALIGAGWRRTLVFPKLIVGQNSLVATDKLSMIVCRWFSSWAIRAQSLANSASVISFLSVFVFAARLRRSNNEPFRRYRT